MLISKNNYISGDVDIKSIALSRDVMKYAVIHEIYAKFIWKFKSKNGGIRIWFVVYEEWESEKFSTGKNWRGGGGGRIVSEDS